MVRANAAVMAITTKAQVNAMPAPQSAPGLLNKPTKKAVNTSAPQTTNVRRVEWRRHVAKASSGDRARSNAAHRFERSPQRQTMGARRPHTPARRTAGTTNVFEGVSAGTLSIVISILQHKPLVALREATSELIPPLAFSYRISGTGTSD